MKLLKATLTAAILAATTTSANAAVTTLGSVSGNYTINSSGSISDSTIESTLGMAFGSLDALSTGNATTGSAIYDTLSVNIGDTFSFDWLWNSTEGSGSYYNDFAFVNLSLDGLSLIADTFTADNSTGTFSWTSTSSGILSYGIGVMDVGDTAVNSYLTVSNIQNTVSAVPEASSIAMMLGGLGLVGFMAARRKKQA